MEMAPSAAQVLFQLDQLAIMIDDRMAHIALIRRFSFFQKQSRAGHVKICKRDEHEYLQLMKSIAKAYRRKGRSRPFLQFGLPLVTLTVVGALGIGHLHQGRRDVAAVLDEQGWERIKDTEGLTQEGPLGQNMHRKNKKTNLEEELKVMKEKMDINSFEYKKIPRPAVKE